MKGNALKRQCDEKKSGLKILEEQYAGGILGPFGQWYTDFGHPN